MKLKLHTKNTISMRFLLLFLLLLSAGNTSAQVKTYTPGSFEKVIVSPHIQVNFKEGDTEKVIIHDISEPIEKLNVEFSGKTLHLYLDGAKTVTKNEKGDYHGYDMKHPIYSGTVVRATVIYKKLTSLSLRGEQEFECSSTLKGDKFKLTIYGESEVEVKDTDLNALYTTIYGESKLEIRNGRITDLKIVSYGESDVNSLGAVAETVRITSYGESKIMVHATKRIKVTSYGESRVRYKGSPEIDRGIIVGDASIKSID